MNRIVIGLMAFIVFGTAAFANSNYTYLALGDSVPFGMNVTLLPPYSQHTPTPSDFIGYPETAAATMRVSEVNASCPGETSGSFLDITMPDNGCNSPHLVAAPGVPLITIPPFKTTIGLHANYSGAQMDFAISQLKANPRIDLVTLNIGANDVLLVLEECSFEPNCVNGLLPSALTTYAANLATILTGIRAHYQGTLIVMTYYSPNPALNMVTEALNGVMTQVAGQLSTIPGIAPITVTDGFAAFQSASVDACQAGLLIPLPPSPYDLSACDIHPSALGRNLLATLVELAAPPVSTACNGTFSGTFVGNLSVSKGQTCMFLQGGVTGNITQNGGNLILSGTTVGGNVQVQGGGAFSAGSFTRILGNLQVQNLPASATPNALCGMTVNGNLTYQNNAASVEIGAVPACSGNMVGGNLQVGNNTANVGIVGNIVKGNLQVQNDTGQTIVSNNNVAKDLQCSGNTTISGSGNTALQKQGQCAPF